MKFGKLILRKIITIFATRCLILGLKKQKSISAGAPLQTPLGELTAFPRPPSWIWGPTSKGREGKRRGEERERGGRLLFQTF